MDKGVKKYIDKQKSPQKEICIKLRKMILGNFPKVKETFMSEGLWYEGKFYLVTFKDHINLGFSVTGLNQKELKKLKEWGNS